MLHALWFYMTRWREDQKRRKYALAAIRANGWRNMDVMRSEATRHATSWKRALR